MSAFKTTTVFFSGALGFSVLPSCFQSAIYSEISLQLYTFLFSHLHIAFLPYHFFSTYTSWNRFEHVFSHVVNCTPSGKNVRSLSHAHNNFVTQIYGEELEIRLHLQESVTTHLPLATMLWYNNDADIDPATCQIFQKFYQLRLDVQRSLWPVYYIALFNLFTRVLYFTSWGVMVPVKWQGIQLRVM